MYINNIKIKGDEGLKKMLKLLQKLNDQIISFPCFSLA